MIKALLIAAAVTAGSPIDDMRASRVFKLCFMEDPECVALLVRAQDVVIRDEDALPDHVRRVCANGNRLNNQQLVRTFMQIAALDPNMLNMTLIEFERVVLRFAMPCRR